MRVSMTRTQAATMAAQWAHIPEGQPGHPTLRLLITPAALAWLMGQPGVGAPLEVEAEAWMLDGPESVYAGPSDPLTLPEVAGGMTGEGRA